MLLDNAEYLEQLKDVVENSGLNWKCLDKKSVMVTGAAECWVLVWLICLFI